MHNKNPKLEEQIEQFETIFNTVQAGINVVDVHGKILFVNDAYSKMNGYSKQELIGKSLAMILPDQDPKKGLEQYKKIIHKEIEKPTTVESFNIRRNGTSFPVLISWNYLVKDGKLQGMVTVIQDTTEIKKIKNALEHSKEEIKQLKSTLKKREYLEYVMGDSPQIKEVHKAVENVAKTDFSIIIYGETGTGKEIIAAAIHSFSDRENKPLISVDCGAIPETLIESELFGYIKGSFTGATETREGAFQQANHSTIFLDEITNLSSEMQKKLLRVLQEKEVQKIGSTKKEKLDIRIISASNEDITKMVKAGSFRKDLFFRLNEFLIKIPPLRNRKEDIPFLTQRFIKEICSKLKIKKKNISNPALKKMYENNWLGNVRELKNTLKRAIVICDETIEPYHFEFIDSFDNTDADSSDAFDIDLENDQGIDLKAIIKERSAQIEQQIVQKALEKFKGNKSKTARFLNIDYKTMLSKVQNM